MQVFIQNLETKGFLKNEGGDWCQESSEAQAFTSSVEALNFCIKQGFKNVQLVLKFTSGHHEDEMIIPLKNDDGQKPRSDESA